MTTKALWYPQLDVYDAIRRFFLLTKEGMLEAPKEVYFILDFFLSNPPLLEYVSMPRAMRNEFSSLGIESAEKAFLSYPSAQVLFRKMAPVQEEAVRTLAAKGFLDLNSLKDGTIRPMYEQYEEVVVPLTVGSEPEILKFLLSELATFAPSEVRRRTGLKRDSAR